MAKLCDGIQEEGIGAVCDGPDVRHVVARDSEGDKFEANWCSDCRADALQQGYVILEVQDA